MLEMLAYLADFQLEEGIVEAVIRIEYCVPSND